MRVVDLDTAASKSDICAIRVVTISERAARTRVLPPPPRADFVRQPTILYDFLRLMVAPLCPRDRSAIAFISLDVLFGVGFGAVDSCSLPTSKDDAGVDASEAESVRNRMLYRHAPGLTGDEVDAFRGRVAIFEIESGRRDLVA